MVLQLHDLFSLCLGFLVFVLQLNLPLVENCNEIGALCIPRKFHKLNLEWNQNCDSCHLPPGDHILQLTRQQSINSNMLRKHFNLYSDDSQDENEIMDRMKVKNGMLSNIINIIILTIIVFNVIVSFSVVHCFHFMVFHCFHVESMTIEVLYAWLPLWAMHPY